VLSRICNIVTRAIDLIVILFPIVMATILGIVYLFGGWGEIIEGHTLDYYFLDKINISVPLILYIFLWILSLFGLTCGFTFLLNKLNKQLLKKVVGSICVFILAFGVRYVILGIYSEDLVPYSDFAASWERAKGNFDGGNLQYYSLFPSYLNFSIYENLIIKAFGDSFINVLYIDAVYCGVTASFLYLIAGEIIHNEVCSLFVCVLYALYPSNILYTASATPDFITICFNTIGIYALVKCIKENDALRQIVWTLVGGFLLGIGGSFKTYSVVMIVAFIMVRFIFLLKCEQEERRNWMFVVLLTILVMLGYKYATISILDKSSLYYDMELTTRTATPHYLLIGLNTESEGQIHIGTISRLYNQYYLSNGLNYEEAKEYAYSLLLNDWKNNANQIIPNFFKKMIWAWQDDYIPIRYFITSVGIHPNTMIEKTVFDIVENYGAGVGQISYLLVLVLAMVGALSCFRNKAGNMIYVFIALIIIGYFCMVFLAEGQSRYKCLVMPYIMILSGLGTERILQSFYLKMIKRLKGGLKDE